MNISAEKCQTVQFTQGKKNMSTADIDEISVSELDGVSSSNCVVLTAVGASISDPSFFDFPDSSECVRSVQMAFKWSASPDRSKVSAEEILRCRSSIDEFTFRVLMWIDARDSDERDKFAVTSWVLLSARGAIEAVHLLAKKSVPEAEVKRNVAQSLNAFCRARRRLGDSNPQATVRVMIVSGQNNDAAELTKLVSSWPSKTAKFLTHEGSASVRPMHSNDVTDTLSEVDSRFLREVETIITDTLNDHLNASVSLHETAISPERKRESIDSAAFNQVLLNFKRERSTRNAFDVLSKSLFSGFLVSMVAAFFSNQLIVFFVTLIASTLVAIALIKPSRIKEKRKAVFEDFDYPSFSGRSTIRNQQSKPASFRNT